MFYGAAEFSRDTDLLILAETDNLRRLRTALVELGAECVGVPPFEVQYLERGHAVHFRCHHPEASSMRIDLMSKLRGMEPFPAIWERRTSLAEPGGMTYELLGLPDLVQAKKTQRSKDWPMLRRLMEAHYLRNRNGSTPEQQRFWFRELRTPELLVEAMQLWPQLGQGLRPDRPLLSLAEARDLSSLESALAAEERTEQERDRLYWQPLRVELEQLRHTASQGKRRSA